MSATRESPLEQLAAEAGRNFANLLTARKKTAAVLSQRRKSLTALDHDSDASVVLMGSWGRAEVTSGSDDDFMVLVRGVEREGVNPSVEDVGTTLGRPAGGQGIFGQPVFSESLVDNIGLDRDDNSNLTRRMLLMLESVPVSGESAYEQAREEVLQRYLGESIKDFRPPRFLLPVLDSALLDAREIRGFLEAQFWMPPTDRIADSFLRHGAADAGARAIGAYDEFLGLLDDEEFRKALNAITRESAGESPEFAEVKRLGRELESGLLALLFETNRLSGVVRDYAIF